MKQNYPLQAQADELARYGRHGDSMLVHMNPEEVAGIASLAPGGLTINPYTGQPEAFKLSTVLPIVAGGIASMFLGPLGAGLVSGVATGALTGDWKRGLAAGIMGAGIGGALSGASAAGAGVAEGAITAGAENSLATGLSPILDAAGGVGAETAANVGSGVLSQVQPAVSNMVANTAEQGIGSMMKQKLADTFTGEGGKALVGEFSKPRNLLPIAVGGGQLAEMDARDQWEQEAEQIAGEKRKEKMEAWNNLQRGYALAQPYARGYGSGGKIVIDDEGNIKLKGGANQFYDDFLLQYGLNAKNPGYGGIDPVEIQKNLRHTQVPVPQNYIAGFNPEMQYFQRLEEGHAPTYPNYTSPQNSSNALYAGSPINRFLQHQMPDPYYRQPLLPQQPPQVPNVPFNPQGDNMPMEDNGKRRTVAPPITEEEKRAAIANRGRTVGGGGGFDRDARKQKKADGGRVALDTSLGQFTFAEGGIASVPPQLQQQQAQPSEQDIMQVAAAVTGQVDQQQADAIVNSFIQRFGPELFQQIRQMILQSMQPGAQTEGMVQGEGGGMDDQVQGTIGGQQPVAVSPGEYIVPADVVSGLGDGSSDAGAAELDKMQKRVRMARGGSAMQPGPINPTGIMPA